MSAIKKFLGLSLACLTLTGCDVYNRMVERIDSDRETVEELQTAMVRDATSRAVTVNSGPKFIGERYQWRTEQPLPPLFESRMALSTTGRTLDAILGTVSETTGIPMQITEFANATGSSGDTTSAEGHLLSVNWDGSLRGLLDQLARDSGLYWRYDRERRRVEFFLYETRHFPVTLPMGTRTLSGSISGAASGSSGGGGPGASTTGSAAGSGAIGVNISGFTVDPYGAISRTIASMLLEDDGQVQVVDSTTDAAATTGTAATLRSAVSNRSRVVVSPELAMVTVTAPPPSLERVARYLDSINAQFSRNLTIDLKIFDVTLTEEAGVGFSLDAVYQRMNDYGLSVIGGPGLTLNSGTPGQITFEVTNPSSRFEGSRLLAQALSSFGSVSVGTSGQVLAVNGQPAPYQVADQITYLASSSVTQTAGVGTTTTTTLTPGTIVVGLTANFLPQILADNRILLQYQLTVSSLRGLEPVTSGGLTIQTPEIFTQSLQQQAVLRDGQSVVLFGYEQDRGNANSTFSFFSGNRAGGGTRTLRVIQLQVFGGGNNA